MDRIDIFICILLAIAIIRGLKTGILQLALSTIGFILGLILGSWLSLALLSHLSDTTDKLLLTLVIVLASALSLSIVGELIGLKLHFKAIKLHLGTLNEVLGALFEMLAVFFVIWIISPSVSNIEADNVGYYVQHSNIIKALDSILPTPPDYISRLRSLISPNSFPQVFIGLEPTHTTISANNKVNQKLILADENSVVQVEGDGCGGIVEGSGFIVDKDLVVTSAHVIAGIEDPKVIDTTGRYNARPIYFDPNMDIAILKVSGISLNSLSLNSTIQQSGNSGATLGYPGGGPLVINNSTVIDEINAEGQNIYGQGQVVRSVYEIQSNVEPGNSGGPLVDANGEVVGIVFAKSTSQPDIGYALSIGQVMSPINNAYNNQATVSDGQCSTV